MIPLDDGGGCLRGVRADIYIYGATPILDPRIKPTLSNGVDLIYKAVENRHSEEGLTGGAHRLAAYRRGRLAPHGSLLLSVTVVCLLECSQIFPSRFHRG
jgi:hypothetical protein